MMTLTLDRITICNAEGLSHCTVHSDILIILVLSLKIGSASSGFHTHACHPPHFHSEIIFDDLIVYLTNPTDELRARRGFL